MESTIAKRQGSAMEWSKRHDAYLCREILTVEPFRFRKGTTERGKLWNSIAETLNSYSKDEIYFKVNQRSVRERFQLLKSKYNQKNRDEEKASGISPEAEEVDTLLEEICDKEKVAEENFNSQSEETKKKSEKDKLDALDARKKAMERCGETKKRENEDGEAEIKPKRKRRSGNETIEYLKEKSERDYKVKELELELKRKEQEGQEKRRELEAKQQQNTLNALQQQTHSLQVLMQQQQQQNQTFVAFLEKINSETKIGNKN